MSSEDFEPHRVGMSAFAPFVGRLIELSGGVEANRILHASCQQVKKLSGLAVLVELRADFIKRINGPCPFTAPKGAVPQRDFLRAY